MIHLGDITKIDGSKITPVDIITFGSPCQDLSVAGCRKGLDGERSGLFMEAVRIIKEMRNATKQLSMRGADESVRICPRIAIWENVPGAFSSNKGEDFRCVLEELARIENPEVSIPMPKKWFSSGTVELPNGVITWRTHDAQYWGVPQRRKRISLIVDFRDEPEPQIQFISESVSGDIEQSKQTGKEIAGTVGESADTTVSFQERCGKPGGEKEYLSKPIEQEPCLAKTTKPYCIGNGQLHDALTPSETCKTLNTMADPMKVVCVGNGQLMQLKESEKVGALNCMHDQQAVLCIDQGGGKSMANVSVDQAPTLTTTHYGEPAVCYGLDRASFNQGQNAQFDFSVESDMAQTLVSKGPGGVMQTK
jgi:DNA (cytosine-5)-methyltransferase 1